MWFFFVIEKIKTTECNSFYCIDWSIDRFNMYEYKRKSKTSEKQKENIWLASDVTNLLGLGRKIVTIILRLSWEVNNTLHVCQEKENIFVMESERLWNVYSFTYFDYQTEGHKECENICISIIGLN